MLNIYKIVISGIDRGHQITDLSCGRGDELVIEPRISVRKGGKISALTVCPVDGLSQDGLEVICVIFLTVNPENERFLLWEVGTDSQEASSLR